MQKWEYTWDSQPHGLDYDERMNAFGVDGWELVSVVQAPTDKVLFFYKRPKQDTSEITFQYDRA